MNFEHGRSTIVRTDKGLLRGFKHDDVYHFYGVEYAKADRFMPPREVEAWEGVKDAINYGFTCPPHIPEKIGNNLKNPHRFWPKSEDCLNLNVWAKEINTDKKKPVVFWIHGGGYHYGSCLEQASYDGRNLCYFNDVVVVSVNHRLNVLGYFNLSNYGEKYKHSANVGNLDLIAALKWVQRNISLFGGDPDNVTLFGQSGGGNKITNLLNMPAAEGLFHKAMLMSGVMGDHISDHHADSQETIAKMLEMLQIPDDEVYKLETMNHTDLANAYQAAHNALGKKGMAYIGPTKNEDYLGDPLYEGFLEQAKSIPVIVGSVFSEFFNLPEKYDRSTMTEEEMVAAVEAEFTKEHADIVIPLFKKAFPEMKTIDVLTYDCNLRNDCRLFAKARVDAGCTDTYNYFFTPVFNINDGQTCKHSSDIPFMMHSTDKVPSADFGEGFAHLEYNMSTRFINFAKTGKPQLENEEYWPACNAEQEVTMVFNANSNVRYDFDKELREAVAKARVNKPRKG